ncbi:MAG: hypothetical protein Q8O19_04270, partial [Rectinemataceae bacterium]|nr:hypothetical protein [Rectinemataceae bacterium]
MEINEEPINWSGDLNDDCTAEWNGLLLRAEWMFGGPKDEARGAVACWWWAVSSVVTGEELASSKRANSGE